MLPYNTIIRQNFIGDNLKFITDFKTELSHNLIEANKKVIIITGYVTVEAFDFVEKLLEGKSIEKIIVFKVDLMDFHNGASSFDFKKAVDNGWKVYINKSIHAKNYIFDDKKVIMGSSNLTSNGLGLNHDRIDDNNTLRDYTSDIKNWVEDKINSSKLITINEAVRMDEYIQEAINETDEGEIKKNQRKINKRMVQICEVINPSKDVDSRDVLMIEKIIEAFIESFKKEPEKYTYILKETELEEIYKVSKNMDWYNTYVIDINQTITHKSFNYNNILYKYTPKIYKMNNTLYLEKIYGEPVNFEDEESVIMFLNALKDMLEIGIAVDNNFTGIYQYKEKIKFSMFYPISDLDNIDEIESEYKKSLLIKCENYRTKSLVEDFVLVGGIKWG
ncbi:phospholipase D family protein [Herbivorax sp. ANBcel31]|uniref:phospholipase D family protein n=1 Tax=Herbivorax sp. ANBcel31 TaxID=3069754 RepID=UPI0027B84725|nr:phospholipase D family protein [Herbivorax sp. ANBcel31]MDQ2087435.1 phospholipase D family protein [Herbivorax sp. ANBcel31]